MNTRQLYLKRLERERLRKIELRKQKYQQQVEYNNGPIIMSIITYETKNCDHDITFYF